MWKPTLNNSDIISGGKESTYHLMGKKAQYLKQLKFLSSTCKTRRVDPRRTSSQAQTANMNTCVHTEADVGFQPGRQPGVGRFSPGRWAVCGWVV